MWRKVCAEVCAIGVGLLWACPAPARDLTADWAAVSEETLDTVRGGFDAGNGLILSLGVERLVSINGNLVASSNFSISDLTKLSADEARVASAALSAVTLVQNGAGNSYQPDLAARPLAALVIQNSVNDQAIRSQTTINTTVNSLSLLKSLNLESGLRDALSGAIGQH